MKQRILSILLVLCMAASLVSVPALAEDEELTVDTAVETVETVEETAEPTEEATEEPTEETSEETSEEASEAAEESTESDELSLDGAGHSHCVCNGNSTVGCDHTAITNWTAWGNRNGLPSTAGNYYLTTDVILTSSNGYTNGWSPKDGTVLCLNGHSITLDSNSAGKKTITVGYNVTFTLTDCQSTGTITHYSTASHTNTGSGVYVESSTSTFKMYGGNISGNSATDGNTSGYSPYDYGGGVDNNGIFYMYGGSISGNTAEYAGGVYNTGSFYMYGGTISGNTATVCYGDNGGGVNNKGSFTMSGGTISGNTAYYGGGVNNTGTFIMSDSALITGNHAISAAGYGGGVYNGSRRTGYNFTMNGGTISNNDAAFGGGGVYSEGGRFQMTAGSITGNTAVRYGGGVFNDREGYDSSSCIPGTFTMSGGSITNNTATGDVPARGGGIFSSFNCTLNLSGDAKITDNSIIKYTSNDSGGGGVYCMNSTTFNLSGSVQITGNTKGTEKSKSNLYRTSTISITSLSDDARIGIEPTDWTVGKTIVSGSGSTTIFSLDSDEYMLKASGKTLILASAPTHRHHVCGDTSCAETSTLFEDWTKKTSLPSDAGNYCLTEDVTLGNNWTWYPANGTVLCLNGHSITCNGYQTIIYVMSNCTVTITDCQGSGTIKHAKGYTGRGIENYGTLNLYGGTITNNSLTDKWDNGSGVYIGSNGTLNMYGGSITGNSITNGLGGGVYCGGTFNVSGKVLITGNTKNNAANNVYLNYGKSINASGLATSAGIGISGTEGCTVVTGYSGSEFFFSDDNGYTLEKDENDLKLTEKLTPHVHRICGGTSCTGTGSHSCEEITFEPWTNTTSLPGFNDGCYYYLTDDVTISETWKPSNNTVLCLNGHTITCTADVSVITSTNEFTITDCSEGKTGAVTHSGGKNGAGVTLNGGKFYLYGGNITGNTNTNANEAAGVYVGGYSKFKMYGGTISSNTGRGVYVYSEFYMYGGSITGNVNTTGSNQVGGGVYNLGIFEMSGGTISGNTAANGGGVYNNEDNIRNAAYTGKFEMSGNAVISGNTATSGGGIYNNLGTFTMSGGTIGGTNAKAANNAQYGGGIYNSNGSCIIYNNATISYNTATSGGGVYEAVNGHLGERKITMSGGTISNNTATKNGGGVYIESGRLVSNTTYYAYFDMTGGTISNNTANECGGGVYNAGKFGMTDAEASISGNTAGNKGGGVYVDSYAGATFTMSGGSISGNKATAASNSYGGGVYNYGTFTMDGGSITGNTSSYCAGGVDNHGSFTMKNGSISGNTATGSSGGGVWNEGSSTFNMNGGTISGNTANSTAGKGGGVYNQGTFNMTSGTIGGTGANSAFQGGGVYNSRTFTMSGGSVTGNTATFTGGGVESQGTTTLSGAVTVTGNKKISSSASTDNNLYLPSGKTITEGGLTEGASIGVTTANEGQTVLNSTGGSQYLSSDNKNYEAVVEDGKVVIKAPVTTYTITINATNATPATSTQTVDKGKAMTAVTLTADEGYYFTDVTVPTGFSAVVAENSASVTISGTPTQDCTITIAASAKTTPAAPTGLSAVKPSSAGLSDGRITGVTSAMEYCVKDTNAWTACSGSEITGLAAGSYEVRYAETNNCNASESFTVTVYDGNVPVYALTVTNGSGSGSYQANESVTITANAPASYMVFDQWVVRSGNVTIADASRASTTVTTGAGAATIEATYKHEHAWSTDWSKSETQHWHDCLETSCTVKQNLEAHKWDDGKVTTPATTTAAGVKTFTCTVCGAARTESIPMLPSITAGNNATAKPGEAKALSFTSNAAYSDFMHVELDGETLDAANYSVEAGSTVVTLKAAYVATLAEGEHTLAIVSANGTATAKFKITAEEPAPVDPDTKPDDTKPDDSKTDDTKPDDSKADAKKDGAKQPPHTGDESHLVLWIVLLVVCIGAVAAILVIAKKNKKK